MQVAALMSIVQILRLVARILLTFAVSNDAKARGLKYRKLFMALTFFFPVIVSIIYICVRSTVPKIVPKMCVVCGATLAPEFTQCPNCGSMGFNDYLVPGFQEYKNKAKRLLISAICMVLVAGGITFAVSIQFVSDWIRDGHDMYNYSDFGDFMDEWENYLDGNDSDMDYYDDYQEDDDSNDLGKDFKNFGNNG
ncbi:MAG: hypothetical protein ACI4IN_06760 [Eubacterium sp.]